MLNLILFYMLLVLIWWLFAFVYKDYMVDCTRQRLFTIRDELFDYAANHEISFNDDAYVTTRAMLNGVIRFTHNISLTRFLIMNLVVGKDKAYSENFSREFSLAIKKLNSKRQQDIIKNAIIKMHFAVVLHLLNTSPVLFPIFLLISAIVRVICNVKEFKEQFYKSPLSTSTLWNSVDAQANLIGRA